MSKVREVGRLLLRTQINNKTVNEGNVPAYSNISEMPESTAVKFWRKPWFSTILAAIYIISPLDFMPDIPVIGFLDDIFLGIIIGLNWAQYSTEESNRVLASLIGLVKWVMIILGIILVLLVAIFGVLIARLFQ